MIISVDHGNKSIKTPHTMFTSGLIESGAKLTGSDYIFWGGKYYTLTERRITYMRDKTEDDRFYILTLFAVAREMEHAGIKESEEPVDITLLIGLPPAHYAQLHSRFEQYILRRREPVEFEYNGRIYTIRIKQVVSYIQALAAAVTRFGDLKKYPASYIIDIGGFTVDVLKLRYGKPDLAVMESFEQGTITLYNSIISQCNSQYAMLLEECDIDEVIKGEPSILPGEVQVMIRTMSDQFLNEFYRTMRERGIDVATAKCVFTGGGSLLLRSMVERSRKVGFPIFIEDIHANAIGYEFLYRSEVIARG